MRVCVCITIVLSMQFLFIEGAEVPQIGSKPYKVKETIKPVSPTRTYNPATNLVSSNSLNYNNGNSTLILYDNTTLSDGGNYRLLVSKVLHTLMCESLVVFRLVSTKLRFLSLLSFLIELWRKKNKN